MATMHICRLGIVIFLRTFDLPARGRLDGKFHGKARALGLGFFRFVPNRPIDEFCGCRREVALAILISLFRVDKLS